ncbi:MAG: LysM peptidoglycan-binding domain-containing protein [Opitutales bacterium]
MDDLDTPSSEFAESESASGAKKWVLVAMLLGVTGLVLGATGIYLATQAANELATLRAEQASTPVTATAEALETLESGLRAELDDIEGRLGNMGGSIVRLQRQGPSSDLVKQVQDLHTQTQSAFDAVSEEVRANRSQLNELSSRLEALGTRRASSLTTAPPALPRPSSDDDEEEPAATTAAPPLQAPEGGSVHTVQPGENLSIIARRHGVTLTALMAANPTVEPRRMIPGDQIVIPAPE